MQKYILQILIEIGRPGEEGQAIWTTMVTGWDQKSEKNPIFSYVNGLKRPG